MLGFVVVSHSKDLAEAVIHLANEMKRYDFPLINGSGTEGDFLGSNPLTIKEAIMNAKTDKGALVFVDIGSSVLNTQVAIDFLADEGVDIENIKIADAPLVEGLIAAVAINDEKADIESILDEFIQNAKRLLKPIGTLYFIHRTHRLIEIIKTLDENKFSVKKIIFVFSKNNTSSMMIIEALKGKKIKLEIENYYV